MDCLKTRPEPVSAAPKKATMSDKVHLTLASALTAAGLYVVGTFNAALDNGLLDATLLAVVAALSAGGAVGVLVFGRRIIRSFLYYG